MLHALRARLERLFPRAQPTLTLPLLPVRGVLFPGGLLPITAFEVRTVAMLQRAIAAGTPFGVCLIRSADSGTLLPHDIGCIARVAAWDVPVQGRLSVRAVGVDRFRILALHTSAEGLLEARVQRLAAESPRPLPPEHAACAGVLEHILARLGEENFAPPFELGDAVWVGYRLAEVLPIKLSAKQNMLEMNDTLLRLEFLHRFLGQQGLIG